MGIYGLVYMMKKKEKERITVVHTHEGTTIAKADKMLVPEILFLFF